MVDGTYKIAGVRIGFRSTSEEFGEWVDRTLDRYRMKRWAFPDYSIVVDEGGGADRRFHLLYKGIAAQMRTRHLPTLARAFLSELETPALAGRNDATYVRASLVTMGDVTALVPFWVGSYVSKMGRRAEKLGLRLPGTEWLALERSGKVVPTAPILDLPRDTPERLAEMDGGRNWDRVFVDRPHAVDVVFTWFGEDEGVHGISRGLALHRLLNATANISTLGHRAAEPVRRLVEDAEHVGIVGMPPPREMVDALGEALAGAGGSS